MTEAEKKLEKEIQEKQQQLHDLRYGEIEKAYKEFEDARDIAIEKYTTWKDAAAKQGRVASPLTFYFNQLQLF